jgi:hypothetical protein
MIEARVTTFARGNVPLHENALLAHFDLHRMRFSVRIVLPDLGRFLARQGDLGLGVRRTMRTRRYSSNLDLSCSDSRSSACSWPHRLSATARAANQPASSAGWQIGQHLFAPYAYSNQCARAVVISCLARCASMPVISVSSSTARSARSSRVLMPLPASFPASDLSIPSRPSMSSATSRSSPR